MTHTILTFRDDLSRQRAIDFISSLAPGRVWEITVAPFRKRRTLEQNRLQRLFINEIAYQLHDQTVEEVRGYCKLTIGVPILRAENDEFRERYDKIVRPLPYDQKLALMMEPFDMPVTRIMTTKQHAKYLDEIQRHFAAQGVILTQPGG